MHNINFGQKGIEDSEYFLALIEKDVWDYPIFLKQLNYAIKIGKPIYILKKRDVALHMEYFNDADIKGIVEFDGKGDLEIATKKLLSQMNQAEEI